MTNLLDNRLRQIYDLVDKDVVDVGTDHGKLVAQLLLDKKITRAVCTDISQASLSKAQKLLKEHNLQDKCQFFVGDGLKVLTQDYSRFQCVIAGMGGVQIIKILSQDRVDNIQQFILQPMKNTILLREWLTNNGYKIDTDIMTRQGKIYYNVLKVSLGEQTLTQQQLLFGKTNLEKPSTCFIDYMLEEQSKFASIVNNPDCKDDNVKNYYDIVCQVLQKIKGE